MITLRQRRLENEWSALKRLEAFNDGLIVVQARISDPIEEQFHLTLESTPAPVITDSGLETAANHQVLVQYPAYFPAVPMQVFLSRPVLHPNVHPDTGFVCIWDRTSPGDSILQALLLLQKVIAWELKNLAGDHVMQPDAVERWNGRAPLAYTALRIPPDFRMELDARCSPPPGRRRRLFSAGF